MRDLGTLLTTTGVVATLFAVLFAATGMYLQYRKSKRNTQKAKENNGAHDANSLGHLVAFGDQDHVTIAEGGKIVKEEVTSKKETNSFEPPQKNTIKDSGPPSPPVFKKYTPSGMDATPIEDSTEYIWE